MDQRGTRAAGSPESSSPTDDELHQEEISLPSGSDSAAPPVFFYYLNYPCRLKRRLSFEDMAILLGSPIGLDGVVKSLHQAVSEHELAGGERTELPPLVRSVATNDGFEEVTLDATEALRKGLFMLRNRKRCRDCPANISPDHGGGGYGCTGFIPTPVTGESERGLMNLIEQLMSTDKFDASAAAPIRHIWDNGIDGKGVASLREASAFSHPEGITARVGPFLDKHPITSDQVLELFLCRDMISLEYIFIFHSFMYELNSLLNDDPAMRESIGPLARFFETLLLAVDLEVSVHLAPYFLAPLTEKTH